MQRWNVKQASAAVGWASFALFHVRVNVFERTSNDELLVLASPTHLSPAHDNDVSVVHALGVGLALHVVPPSVVT
jgi:hypothetical protein